MEWSKKAWVALALGTVVTLLSMRSGLLSLRQVRGQHGESEEYLWLVSNGGAPGLPLEQSKLFTGYLKGYAGGQSPQTEEFQRILHDTTAEETFAGLAHAGPEGARLYGLCDSRRFVRRG